MGLIGRIFGSTAAAPIDAIGNVIDKVFTSDQERLEAQAVLEKLRQHPDELQVELNKIEAAHQSIFVAGWRPFIGWVCGISLCFDFLINPIIQWITGKPGPTLSTESLMELVIAMLGLGILRTYEKVKGITK
jgi:hypothetical protein